MGGAGNATRDCLGALEHDVACLPERAGMSLDEEERLRSAEDERHLHLVRSRMRMARDDV
jgi:hypothetical protein